MNCPIISIIIPVYNVERYIKRCLDSLLVQTFQDFEVVIVNDATPDRSMDSVRAFCKKWSAVTIVEHKKNMGLMWTRKSGYQIAKGNYFVFLDSDDWLPENALENLKNAIDATNADIVSGAFTITNDNGALSKIQSQLNYGNDSKSVYKSMLNEEFYHNLWGRIYKAELFRLYKYDNYENYTNGEDGLLLYQLLQNAKKVVCISENVYFYYRNAMSSTNVKLSDQAIESVVILNSYRARVKNLYPDLTKECDAKISSVLINLIYSTKRRSLLYDLIEKYKLLYYVKNTTIIKSHPLTKGLKLLIKKLL